MPHNSNTPVLISMEEINGTPGRERSSINKEETDPTDTIERRSMVTIGETHHSEHHHLYGEKPFDFNQYATRKTIASSLLDLALLSANACQLKICLQLGPEVQQFFHLLMVLISTSIILQISAAIMFLLVARGNVGDSETEEERNNQKRTALLNDIATGLVFLITVVNVFITAFGMTEKVDSENSRNNVAVNKPKTLNEDTLKPTSGTT